MGRMSGVKSTTLPPAPPAFDPKTLPAVVARVNGTDITREQVIDEARGAFQQLRKMGRSPAIDAALFRGALDQRIASMLLYAEAQSRGVAATPDEVEQRMSDARARFESDQAFAESLAAQGLSAETARAEAAQEISRFKYVEKVILPEIKVPDEMVRSFYDKNIELMKQPERVKVRHILIAVPPTASEPDRALARKRAEDVLAKAKAGEDFATLARESSDHDSKDQGGELPWLAREDIKVPAFEQAAFALEKGTISGLVETPNGFHIIQALDRKAARTAEFDEVKDRILSLLQTQEAQERLRQTVDGLMAKAKIERFAL